MTEFSSKLKNYRKSRSQNTKLRLLKNYKYGLGTSCTKPQIQDSIITKCHKFVQGKQVVNRSLTIAIVIIG